MTTTKEILAELKAKGFQVIQHPDRELYIAYSERRLLHTGCGISETSIEWLKEMFDGPPQEKEEGSNISNQEAQVRILRMELALQELLKPGKLDELFPLLPLTKAGKFHKTAATNLYIPGIKYTVNEDYFSQSEVSLQIAAYRWLDDDTFNWAVCPEIGILRINPDASFVGRKTPPNLIDEKGKCRRGTSRRQPSRPRKTSTSSKRILFRAPATWIPKGPSTCTWAGCGSTVSRTVSTGMAIPAILIWC